MLFADMWLVVEQNGTPAGAGSLNPPFSDQKYIVGIVGM
jgi:hypothetical protein